MAWSAAEKLEFKKALEVRTRNFAVLTFRYLDALPRSNSGRVIAYQLGKSASSVGANYREANRCESVEDFSHKMAIVLKECSESRYWLEILCELRPKSETCTKLLEESDELLRLFQTVERKLKSRRKTKTP